MLLVEDAMKGQSDMTIEFKSTCRPTPVRLNHLHLCRFMKKKALIFYAISACFILSDENAMIS